MPIALITDFGGRDYYVAAMKGVILSIAPDVPIVDITHEVSPQKIHEAAFILEACYRNFPAGTVFVAVVDPGVGSTRKAMVSAAGGYYYVGPDNGIFSFVFDAVKEFCAFEILNDRYVLPSRSSTFHGRDVFAPAAAHLAAGAKPDSFGPPIVEPVKLPAVRALRISENESMASVLHIDRFGNIVTNIRSDELAQTFNIKFKGKTIDRVYSFFAEAEAGEVFAIKGSAGYVEIAVRDGSAQSALGAHIGDEVLLTREIDG